MSEEFSTQHAAVTLPALEDADKNRQAEIKQYKHDGPAIKSDGYVEFDTTLNYSTILVAQMQSCA